MNLFCKKIIGVGYIDKLHIHLILLIISPSISYLWGGVDAIWARALPNMFSLPTFVRNWLQDPPFSNRLISQNYTLFSH